MLFQHTKNKWQIQIHSTNIEPFIFSFFFTEYFTSILWDHKQEQSYTNIRVELKQAHYSIDNHNQIKIYKEKKKSEEIQKKIN